MWFHRPLADVFQMATATTQPLCPRLLSVLLSENEARAAVSLPVLWMDTGEVSTLVAMALSLFLKNSRGLSERWAMMAFAS